MPPISQHILPPTPLALSAAAVLFGARMFTRSIETFSTSARDKVANDTAALQELEELSRNLQQLMSFYKVENQEAASL